MTPAETCTICGFFKPMGNSSVGLCRRYPGGVKMDREGWCGEWTPAAVIAKPLDELREPDDAARTSGL